MTCSTLLHDLTARLMRSEQSGLHAMKLCCMLYGHQHAAESFMHSRKARYTISVQSRQLYLGDGTA